MLHIIEKEFNELYAIVSIFKREMVYDFIHEQCMECHAK